MTVIEGKSILVLAQKQKSRAQIDAQIVEETRLRPGCLRHRQTAIIWLCAEGAKAIKKARFWRQEEQ